MLKWLILGVALVLPCAAQAQDTMQSGSTRDCKALSKELPPAPDKKAKKPKVPKDKLIPLSVVVCEVENALDAYQRDPEVTGLDGKEKDPLPHILTADFDFKTVVDTKGTLGIGFYIFKLGGSYDKQTTNEVDFQYQPKAPGKNFLEAKVASFQEELLKTLKNAAKAIKDEQANPIPVDEKNPLVFKQLTVTLNYGVTWDVNGGISVPINIITLTAALDRSKNNVQSVKLVFGPPPKS